MLVRWIWIDDLLLLLFLFEFPSPSPSAVPLPPPPLYIEVPLTICICVIRYWDIVLSISIIRMSVCVFVPRLSAFNFVCVFYTRLFLSTFPCRPPPRPLLFSTQQIENRDLLIELMNTFHRFSVYALRQKLSTWCPSCSSTRPAPV